MKEVLTEKQLGMKFDSAIKALETNDGDGLMQLSALLHLVAMTNNEPTYFLVSDVLGEVGHHFNQFYPLTTPLFLGKNEQTPHYQTMYKTAKEECVKALRAAQTELCEKDTPNHANLVNSLGTLIKHTFVLASKRQSVMRSQPPFHGMPPQEED